MVLKSIRGILRWGNLHSHCPAPVGYLRHMGEVWLRAWASPFFLCLVLGDFPPHLRFLVRPQLLTRLYSLPVGRDIPQFISTPYTQPVTPLRCPLQELSPQCRPRVTVVGGNEHDRK